MFNGIITNTGKVSKIYKDNNDCIIEILSKMKSVFFKRVQQHWFWQAYIIGNYFCIEILYSQNSIEKIKSWDKTNHSIMINNCVLILDGWILYYL